MLRKIQPDKWKHFIVGIPMGSVLQIACNWLVTNPLASGIIAFVIVAGISYGFELFSKITGLGRYDFMDAVASVIGGVLGMGLVWLF
ncbi:MAG: hypothetical protein KF746_06555 [Chitinophagaceae bacterium]|nr:hypothetical protein [Chitinophagaceae bacterium]